MMTKEEKKIQLDLIISMYSIGTVFKRASKSNAATFTNEVKVGNFFKWDASFIIMCLPNGEYCYDIDNYTSIVYSSNEDLYAEIDTERALEKAREIIYKD